MRVAICDDEAIYREETKACIRGYSREIEIVEFTDGEELLCSTEEFDLIFLDIEMAKVDGVTTAKKLRERKVDTEIVFLTSHQEYIYEAFDVRAQQFLKKPMETERIVKELKKVEEEISKMKIIEIAANGVTTYIKLKDVVYIESYGDGVYLYDRMGNSYDDRRGSLKKWKARLEGKGFVQIHRSYLISMFHIENFGSENVKLQGIEQRLEVSRRYAAAFKKTFTEFVMKNGRVV